MAPLPPWPYDEVPLAPIVVRDAAPEAILREDAALRRAAGVGASELIQSVLAIPMYGIGLFLVPFALVDAQRTYIAERCPAGARSVLGDMPNWVRSTFGAMPAAEIVAEEARRHVKSGGPVIFVAPAEQDRMASVATIAERSAARTLVLADVYVSFGELDQASCALRLVARAEVRVQPRGQPEVSQPRYHLWAELDQIPVDAWATDPALAREQLGTLLRQLGARLVESYRHRMGCDDRPCPW